MPEVPPMTREVRGGGRSAKVSVNEEGMVREWKESVSRVQYPQIAYEYLCHGIGYRQKSVRERCMTATYWLSRCVIVLVIGRQ